MNWIRRAIVAVGLSRFLGVTSESAGILSDVTAGAQSGAGALIALGFKADFTFESIRELERFMDANVEPEGGAKPGGEFSDNVGGKLFVLGCYLGECLRRELGWQWKGDDNDPDATINVAVVDPGGDSMFWPIQRIMKRFQNGKEDDLWFYAIVMTKKE